MEENFRFRLVGACDVDDAPQTSTTAGPFRYHAIKARFFYPKEIEVPIILRWEEYTHAESKDPGR